MSHDERTSLESIVQALFHGSLGKFVVWLRWLVVCVITGTIAVVGFVIEVRNGVKEAQAAADRNTRRIEQIEARQQSTNDLVQRHDAILSRSGGE